MHKKQNAMFALTNGVQGRSPCNKKRCHPEARPQAAFPPGRSVGFPKENGGVSREDRPIVCRRQTLDHRAALIYKGGAVPVRWNLM